MAVVNIVLRYEITAMHIPYDHSVRTFFLVCIYIIKAITLILSVVIFTFGPEGP